MAAEHKIFVGYFRSDLNVKKIAGFLRQHCPDIERFEARKKKVGFQGAVRYILATLASERNAEKAVRRLNGATWKGHSLMVRICRERTSANERRSVDWREKKWDGPERRVRDRRSYKRSSAGFADGDSHFLVEALIDPKCISFSNEEAERFLTQAIQKDMGKRKQTRAYRPGKESLPGYWGYNDHV